MREDWQTVKLGDVLKTSSGGTPTRSRKEYYEGGKIPWLMSGEVAQGNVYEAKKFITEEGLKNSSAKMFPPETVLVAMYGATAGQVGILRVESTTNQAVCGIFPSQEYVPEFLYYSILQQQKDLIKAATGNAQPNISQTKIKDIQIPLPPLAEQERIVSILDKAFEGIDKAIAQTEQNLASARELFESYLNSLDFSKHSLGQYVTIRTGKLNANAAVDEGEYPFFTCSREISRINAYAFDMEAILLAGNNASGDFNVKHYAGKFNAYQRTYVISAKEDSLDYRFLYHQLNKSLKELKRSAVGAGTKFLKLGMIQDLKIQVPSVEQQQATAKTLDQLLGRSSKLEALYTQKLKDLKELKQSLLQQAFAGELTKEDAA
ncbi:restriction endonuclease subunit S [Akkermansiaceae bacterium]|nr:restriction endonuclease subunit S [Akkermansiaceae bacterium]